ncbi:hypothetical protein KAR91_66885 [Candidatus Pacearchaeota archaeon]|nr:hypothetical protein [Candidatus Pacearchaeota archaeon]
MHLINWLSENWRSLSKSSSNLHVIGTCGNCEHRKYDNTDSPECGSPKPTPVNQAWRDFGCIHWEKKEK